MKSVPLAVLKLTGPPKVPRMSCTSIQDTFCPRYFMWRYRLGVRSGESTPALRMGRFFHEIVAAVLGGKSHEDAIKLILDKSDDDSQEKAAAGAMALSYLERDPLKLQGRSKVAVIGGNTMVEQKLYGRFKELDTTGILDLVVDIELSPTLHDDVIELLIVDHKLTAWPPGNPEVLAVIGGLQGVFYYWLLNQNLRLLPGNYKIVGVATCYVKRCNLKFCPAGKDKEHGFEGYLDRVREFYDNDDNFVPEWSSHSTLEGRIPELEARLEQESFHFQGDLSLPRYWRAGTSKTCIQFNSSCEYAELCMGSPSGWHTLLRGAPWKLTEKTDDGK